MSVCGILEWVLITTFPSRYSNYPIGAAFKNDQTIPINEISHLYVLFHTKAFLPSFTTEDQSFDHSASYLCILNLIRLSKFTLSRNSTFCSPFQLVNDNLYSSTLFIPFTLSINQPPLIDYDWLLFWRLHQTKQMAVKELYIYCRVYYHHLIYI